VKWRFFRHLLHGGDSDAGRIYRWHIETRKGANASLGLGMDSKSGADAYVSDCHRLLVSIRANGFLASHAIPIDPDGELLGGAHRVACSLALGLEEIPVRDEMRRVWAPAWDEAWFRSNGMGADDLERVRQDMSIIELNDHSHPRRP